MSNLPSQNTHPVPDEIQPWYKQFWPWFIIALPASVVVASFFTLWLALSNPDPLVVEDHEYQRLSGELKAQSPAQAPAQETEKGGSDQGNE